jgi:hypothetical protein
VKDIGTIIFMIARHPIDLLKISGYKIEERILLFHYSERNNVARQQKNFARGFKGVGFEEFFIYRELEVEVGAVLEGHGTKIPDRRRLSRLELEFRSRESEARSQKSGARRNARRVAFRFLTPDDGST